VTENEREAKNDSSKRNEGREGVGAIEYEQADEDDDNESNAD